MASVNRYLAQKALAEHEWLDHHVAARTPRDEQDVEAHLDELGRLLLRLAGASTDEESEDTTDD